MAFRLSEKEIRQRLVERRNLKVLHSQARQRIAKLLIEIRQFKTDKTKLKQLIRVKDKTILQLRDQLADKEVQRKELLGFLYKETKKKEGKQGREKRQGAYHRPQPPDEDVTDHQTFILKRCPMCRTQVGEAVDEVTKFEEDIDLRPRHTVKAYTITRHWCPKCETFVKSEVPKIQRIGLNTLGYILYSRYRLRLPFNKIQESLRDLFDFKISEGEISTKLTEAKTLFGKDYESICELIKVAKVVYADETGWRMNGEGWWLWVFVTDQGIVRYLLEGSRGGGIPKEALGDKQDRVLVSDAYAVYNNLPGEHQQCWIHLLRITKLASLLMYADVAQLYTELGEELLKPVNDRDPPRFKKRLREIREFHYHPQSKAKLEKARNRIKRDTDNLLTCLNFDNVLPENNTAERAIRTQVVMRKVFGGSRSTDGAKAHEVNTSVIETRLKQNPDGSFFDVMLPLLKQRQDEQDQS